MSDAFRDREKGFERKYELDEDLRFRIQSRRNRLFGQWIASKLGLTGADADAYVQDVIAADFEKPGDDDILDKVKRDLVARNLPAVDGELKSKLGELEAEAAAQILGTPK